MQEHYTIRSHVVYNALIRPVLYFGLPMELLFIVSSIPFLIGALITPLIWLLIPVIVFLLGALSKKDPFIFHLLALKFKTKGNAKANRFYGSNSIFAQKYTSNFPIKIIELKKCN